MQEERLQKFFTDCGVLSRRAAEKEIAAGKVKVNGEIATIGQRIDPDTDVVEYGGKIIKKRDSDSHVYVLLNKPTGYVTTLSDEKGRRSVLDLISDVPARVYPVGRLDMNSQGLLLLTNDGELTNRLTHPKHHVPKIYRVSVTGEVSSAALDALRAPMEIDGYRIMPVKTELILSAAGGSMLEMTLFEGRNRQIRKMCEIVGLKIKKLERIAIGEIKLASLPYGKWRYLNNNEIEYLKGHENA